MQRLLLFFVSTLLSDAIGTASPSPSTARLSWQCWPENVKLFADLACSRNGSSYLVARHNLSSDAIPRLDASSSGPAGSHPWTHLPVCTGALEKLGGSELCVYTNAAFGGGRGISIITIPQLAEELTTLPSFKNLTALDGVLHSDLLRFSHKTPSKGWYALANRGFRSGDEIASHVPILLTNGYAMEELSWPEREELLRAAILQLPVATQRLLASLTSAFAAPELFIAGIVENHAGYLVEPGLGGQEYGGFFPEMGFFNHDCAPNSHVRIDPLTLRISFRAARNISQGEEVSITYFMEKSTQGVHFQPFANRQRIIETKVQFRCSCSRCHAGPSTDRALQSILKQQHVLENNWARTIPGGDHRVGSEAPPLTEAATPTPSDARRLIASYKQQGFEVFLDVAYGLAALAYNAVGREKEAKRFADLAARVLWFNGMAEGEAFREWRSFADKPSAHWSWRRRL